jgi:glyoxylase-like metal-dependent hydrolase (beta-lactamase superfamily II)
VILVSHSHFDHTQDVKAIATAGGIPVVGAFEWVQTLGLPDSLNRGGNLGAR